MARTETISIRRSPSPSAEIRMPLARSLSNALPPVGSPFVASVTMPPAKGSVTSCVPPGGTGVAAVTHSEAPGSLSSRAFSRTEFAPVLRARMTT